MAILESFMADRTALTFSDLLSMTELPKSTLHRHLKELESAGLVDRRDNRYRISMRLFELGIRAPIGRDLIEIASPILDELNERTHGTVQLGVRSQNEVLYVYKKDGRHPTTTPSRLGGRMPLHATAIGKTLLAFAPQVDRASVLSQPLDRLTPHTIVSLGLLSAQLDIILEKRVSFEYEESALGVVCVAAPILDTRGAPIAAISLAGAASRFKPANHIETVKSAARQIGLSYNRDYRSI
ncbi:IclR family transcriptional regulator [Dietzia sp. UCD-THP]|uniref:IclR family transcriptional regulator n=1 Tax=Dietzia sp. UCD-THP TaxID=1292020 RepID=UPI001EE651CD|nr:IclR family transcriptional regulator [Dietzia sp. UCD-THP]